MKKQNPDIFLAIVLIVLIITVNLEYFFELSGIIRIPAKYSTIIPMFHTFLFVLILALTLFLFLIIKKLSHVEERTAQAIVLEDNAEVLKKKTEEDEKRQQEEKLIYEQSLNQLLQDLNNQLSIEKYCEGILSNLSVKFETVQGMLFVFDSNRQIFSVRATFAFYSENEIHEFAFGEGIIGQVAKNKELLVISNLPDKYITILSGLGYSAPKFLTILPIIHNQNTIAIIEIATFKKIDSNSKRLLTDFATSISNDIHDITNR